MKTLYENTHVQDIFFLESVFVQWDFMAWKSDSFEHFKESISSEMS